MDKSQRKFKEFMKATHEIMKLATPDMVNGKASRITIEEARRISECLTPFQQATLWKIMLRRTGVEAVADAAVCKALGVDDRQRSDLVGNFHEFTDAYDVVMKAILRGRMKKDKMESLLETAAKNRQTLDDTIAKILTRDQRLRLQQLQDLQ